MENRTFRTLLSINKQTFHTSSRTHTTHISPSSLHLTKIIKTKTIGERVQFLFSKKKHTLLILCEITLIVEIVLVCFCFIFLLCIPHPVVCLNNFRIHVMLCYVMKSEQPYKFVRLRCSQPRIVLFLHEGAVITRLRMLFLAIGQFWNLLLIVRNETERFKLLNLISLVFLFIYAYYWQHWIGHMAVF